MAAPVRVLAPISLLMALAVTVGVRPTQHDVGPRKNRRTEAYNHFRRPELIVLLRGRARRADTCTL
jgi:hypothetical protein